MSEVNKRGRPSKWPPKCLPSNICRFWVFVFPLIPWRKYDSQRPLFGGDFLGQILAAAPLPGAFVYSRKWSEKREKRSEKRSETWPNNLKPLSGRLKISHWHFSKSFSPHKICKKEKFVSSLDNFEQGIWLFRGFLCLFQGFVGSAGTENPWYFSGFFLDETKKPRKGRTRLTWFLVVQFHRRSYDPWGSVVCRCWRSCPGHQLRGASDGLHPHNCSSDLFLLNQAFPFFLSDTSIWTQWAQMLTS